MSDHVLCDPAAWAFMTITISIYRTTNQEYSSEFAKNHIFFGFFWVSNSQQIRHITGPKLVGIPPGLTALRLH